MDEATIVASKAVDKISQTVVPYEVVTPPLELKDFKDLKTFEKQMHLQGASGTKIKPHYAFGLHINPEATSFQTNDLLNVLKTHAMLEKWLVKQHKVDLTRRLTNFIDPFPKNYIKLIIQGNYNPSEEQFIKDYHKYNPTRNRSLDMTPLLCHLNEPLTRKLYGTHEKINKRPTFHYRLPNCEIGQKNWSFTKEWEIWSTVEKIANNDHAVEKLKACWLEYQNSLFHSETLYNQNIDKIIKEHEI